MNRREFNKTLAAGIAVASMPSIAMAMHHNAPNIFLPANNGSRGYPFTSYLDDLAALGYQETEYFIEGKATNYKSNGELNDDGKWSIEPDSQHEYRTRILVRRPIDASKFNGTVLVEWLNVTLGHDIELAVFLSEAIYKKGIAHVLASCQKVGIDGYGEKPQGLKQWDPERYGSLNIPGDSVSFDILSQIGAAVGPNKDFSGTDPLQGLKAEVLIATGASQSAGRLLSYINGVQPLKNIFHGFIPTIHFGMGFAFSDFELNPANPEASRRFLRSKIRDDINAKVFVVNSETEALMAFPSHRPDNSQYRYWEVTGSSHSPELNARRLNDMRARDGLDGTNTDYGSTVLWEPSADIALLHMIDWVKNGTEPPIADKIQVKMGDNKMPEVVRDEHGNALGGLRLPDVEVPTATYTSAILGFQSPLGLRGKTEPFSAEKLQEMYPSHKDYVAKVTAAAKQAEAAGFILPSRTAEYIAAAQAANIGQ